MILHLRILSHFHCFSEEAEESLIIESLIIEILIMKTALAVTDCTRSVEGVYRQETAVAASPKGICTRLFRVCYRAIELYTYRSPARSPAEEI